MLTASSTYDRFPTVPAGPAEACHCGWREILEVLRGRIRPGKFVVCVECYPGTNAAEVQEALSALRPDCLLRSDEALLTAAELAGRFAPYLTDDPVFGRLNEVALADYLDPERLAECRWRLEQNRGLAIVFGPAASLLADAPGLLVYTSVTRWEIQGRQRRGEAGNLGADNPGASAAEKYKRAFFLDWRAADRRKVELFDRVDYWIDTDRRNYPSMVSGEAYRAALRQLTRRPFRVVPYFDPGPWGGTWMKERFDLPDGPPNYAWAFDCVPEENSVRFGFGSGRMLEMPALDVVLRHPAELLGDPVYRRYGAEFPIRFDLLDTWDGGNLSLQVHPQLAYIRERFGMAYTQDESYYLLDAKPGAGVYLGLREDADTVALRRDLERGDGFEAERYVNRWPAKKHDHFLIPAGTIHCSGRDSVVLEISATPYIFTFKLWDWGRLGLDGRPRPIHLDHGMRNLVPERRTAWVREHLIGQVRPVAEGAGWREERTGLHELQPIETRRHWFRGPVPHHTGGVVNVLNLVEGEAVLVESPQAAFEPFAVHYAETFIVPAAVGPYTVRPANPAARDYATMKAWPRTE